MLALHVYTDVSVGDQFPAFTEGPQNLRAIALDLLLGCIRRCSSREGERENASSLRLPGAEI